MRLPKNFRPAPLLFGILALFCANARAAESSAAQFLSLGFGARALGMGEAFTAVADDASAVYYNPAGLPARRAGGDKAGGGELLVSHSWHIQDTGLTQLAYARGPAGFSLTYFSAGSMEGRDDSGNPASDFTAEDFAFSGGYAARIGRLSAGAALKAVRQSIKSSAASAVCADAGLLYGFETAPVTLGVSVSNLGTKIKFEDERFPLPLVYRAGLAVRAGRSFPAVFSAQADFPNDSTAVLRAGAEYTGFDLIALRAGYRTAPASQRRAILGKGFGGSSGLSELYGFYMGLGFAINPVKIDYALLPYGELGSSHRFSISVRF
ncbi:MAG: PorV/PorQ family protein [Elusimicrobiales bacterium]|jgi:hypothetical protein